MTYELEPHQLDRVCGAWGYGVATEACVGGGGFSALYALDTGPENRPPWPKPSKGLQYVAQKAGRALIGLVGGCAGFGIPAGLMGHPPRDNDK
jgi:hypothetical protein